MVVNSTSAEANIEAFDTIFSRHGYCENLTSDNGPPFNGNEYHLLQQYFHWAGIKHNPTDSAEDPEANGLAEAFMKHLAKIWHTAYIEHLNPIAEMNKHLQMVRATPHPTTGKSPAELMYGRQFRTRIPERYIQTNNSRSQSIEMAKDKDREVKSKQKYYKDKKPYVKSHTIAIGDTVLLSQKKTKLTPPYDPEPYCVTEIHGHQITATRNGKTITRDAQKWKKFSEHTRQPMQLKCSRSPSDDDDDDDIGMVNMPTTNKPSSEPETPRDNDSPPRQLQQMPASTSTNRQPKRYPTRKRNQPLWYQPK